MITPITLGGNPVSLVSLPEKPGLASVEFTFTDAVAIVSSPFTGHTQAQQWPGADMWSGTMTLPPLRQCEADDWISFLMELRGMANAFQIGDPLKRSPRGSAAGVPVVDGSIAVAVGSQNLYTAGWNPSAFRLLLPGDYVQVGFRLHRVLGVINSDANGKAAIPVWPSLREVPAAGAQVVLNKPVGIFRLATNKRTWSADVTALTRLSFQIMEYR